jgi:hypothetical protein
MELLLVLVGLVGLVLFDLAALRWGVNSTDGIESKEWERRKQWRGFGGDR